MIMQIIPCGDVSPTCSQGATGQKVDGIEERYTLSTLVRQRLAVDGRITEAIGCFVEAYE